MLNLDHAETTYVIQVAGVPLLPESMQVKVSVFRQPAPEATIHSVPTEIPINELPPFTHKYSVNLSEQNWQGLRNLSYWRRGYLYSQAGILNHALALYLAQHEESQWPIPERG